MARKQQIILTHGSNTPTNIDVAKGEVLVQHAVKAEDAALHTVLDDGETLVAFPSKVYVDEQIKKLQISDVNTTLTSLQNQINTEKSERKTADNNITTAYTAADNAIITAYTAADEVLQGLIEANTTNIEINATNIKNISDDYLKEADKKELEGKITASTETAKSYTDEEVQNLATGTVAQNTTRIAAIEKDYLKSSDKTLLNNAITAETSNRQTADAEIKNIIGNYTTANTVQSAIEKNASAISANTTAIESLNTAIGNLSDTYATDAELASAVTTLEEKITAAQNVTTTKIVEGVDAGDNLEITETTGTTGTTYTITLNDVASASALQGVSGKVNTLIGEDINKSIRTIANEELASQLLGENNAEDNFKTLQDLAAWLEQHPEDAAAMNTTISENKTAIANEEIRAKGVEEGLNNRLTSAETAISTTLPNSINTAKSDAITSAKTYTDEVKTAIESVIGGSYTSTNTVASAISKNANDISSINTQISKLNETYATDAELTSAVTTLEGKITAAQNAATTKVVKGTDAGNNLSVTESTGEDKAVTYTIALNDVASASALQSVSDQVGVINGTGTGSIKKALADAKTYADNKVNDLDATVSGNSTHVTVKVVETDGKLTSVEVSESDIASASGLTSLGNRVTTVEGSYINSAIVTDSNSNKITATVASNTLTLNFNNMVIDGGEY